MGVVDPVGSEEAAESGDEDQAAVVGDCFRQLGDLVRRVAEAQVVHQELDARACDCNAALEGVDWGSIEVVSHRG